MTPVKNELSGRQYKLKANNGRDILYLSNEVKDKINITIGSSKYFVGTNELIDIIAKLKFGDRAIPEAKHAKKEDK